MSEPKTLYVNRSATPGERCSLCRRFESDESACNGEGMRELSERPRLEDGDVIVSPQGWCRFFVPGDAGPFS